MDEVKDKLILFLPLLLITIITSVSLIITLNSNFLLNYITYSLFVIILIITYIIVLRIRSN